MRFTKQASLDPLLSFSEQEIDMINKSIVSLCSGTVIYTNGDLKFEQWRCGDWMFAETP